MAINRNRRITLIRRSVLAGAGVIVLAIGIFGIQYARRDDPMGMEGKEYMASQDPMPDRGAQITVREFFSYACNHCWSFEPVLANWQNILPADVRFERIPVSDRGAWGVLARSYHAMEELQLVEQNHRKIFIAIHEKRRNLSSISAIASLLYDDDRSGSQRFVRTTRSAEVETKLRHSQKLAKRFRISSVPTLVVAGKFIVPFSVRGARNTLQVVDQLIKQERQARQNKL